jgi:hypothetical protein
LQIARDSHPPQLSQTIREPLETAHRDKPLGDETQKELTAAAQINLLDCLSAAQPQPKVPGNSDAQMASEALARRAECALTREEADRTRLPQ